MFYGKKLWFILRGYRRRYFLEEALCLVLKLYGQEVRLFKLRIMPVQMLIDKSGILRYVHYGHSMADIPSNTEIIDLIKDLIKP